MNFSRNPMLVWLDKVVNNGLKYKKQLVICFVAIIGTSGLLTGYLFYKNHANAAAYKDFVNALKYYDGIVMTPNDKLNDPNAKYFVTEQDKWLQTEAIFSQGYSKHKNSKLGCMFLAFRAEALLNLGNKENALNLFNESIRQMPNNDVKDYYNVKIALIKMDKNDANGLTELQKIAENEQSFANDLALYQLGTYYWNQKNFAEAKNYWQRLLVKTGGAHIYQSSPYSQEVKEKLSLFSTENL